MPLKKIAEAINEHNITSLASISGLVLLEAIALFNGIDGAQFGAVIGILGTYAAIKRNG